MRRLEFLLVLLSVLVTVQGDLQFDAKQITVTGKSCSADHICGYHGYSYAWCYTVDGGSDKCCIDKCGKKGGYGYYWCSAGSKTPRCRRLPGVDGPEAKGNDISAKGNLCKEDTCGYHGYDYMWCYVSSGSDRCCESFCGRHAGNSYFCYADASGTNRQDCAPLKTTTTKGKSCRCDHPCGLHGSSYSWCYTDESNYGKCCTDACREAGWCRTGPGLFQYQDCVKPSIVIKVSNSDLAHCQGRVKRSVAGTFRIKHMVTDAEKWNLLRNAQSHDDIINFLHQQWGSPSSNRMLYDTRRRPVNTFINLVDQNVRNNFLSLTDSIPCAPSSGGGPEYEIGTYEVITIRFYRGQYSRTEPDNSRVFVQAFRTPGVVNHLAVNPTNPLSINQC